MHNNWSRFATENPPVTEKLGTLNLIICFGFKVKVLLKGSMLWLYANEADVTGF